MNKPGWLTRLRIGRVALVDRGANPDADIVLVKRESYASMAECMEALGDADKCKALMGEMDAMDKAEREALEKRLKEAEDKVAEATALKKRLEVAEARLAKADEARETEEFIQKAKGFTAIGITPDDGALLRKAYKALTEDEAKRLDAILHGAQAVAEDAKLFKELGSMGAGGFTGSAWEKIEKLAEAMVQKDGKLTTAQAINRVMETAEGKRLYDEYEAERSQAARRVR